MERNVSDFIWEYLYDKGVRHVFTLAGGGSMYLVDALARSKIEPVYMLHEQACAIAADAYAQYTNNLGVCLVTTGPGGTNAITGCVASWIDSNPVLFISGQVNREYLDKPLRQCGPQGVDILKLTEGFTKVSARVFKPEAIKHMLPDAIKIINFKRKGPVWLDIPLDIQNECITSR